MTIELLMKAFMSGGWGVAAVFAALFIAERKGAAAKDAQIFKLLQKQLKLLGSDDED
jgi:hypothetical protein